MARKDDRKDTLISWLNDAHAMEQSLAQVLASHAKHAREHPTIQRRYEIHLDQTRHHAELLQQCVEQLGSNVSTTKSAMGKIAGWFQGASTAVADDNIVKDLLADVSMEHFEIACYNSLITGAEQLGETQVASICRDILTEEEQMAMFLADQVPQVTSLYLAEMTDNKPLVDEPANAPISTPPLASRDNSIISNGRSAH